MRQIDEILALSTAGGGGDGFLEALQSGRFGVAKSRYEVNFALYIPQVHGRQ